MTSSALNTETLSFQGSNGELNGYLATLGDKPLPGVVIVHENQGLTAHIQDVSRRLAQEGFAVLALDALSGHGGTPSDKDAAIAQIKQLDDSEVIANYQTAIDVLKDHPCCTGKVASLGFCWGGRVSGLLAVHSHNLDAAIIYYGKSPDSKHVEQIQCPLLLHYGATDEAINATVPAFQAALDAHGKSYTLHMHEGAGHAFNNDTRKDRYHADAAVKSWKLTVDFLQRTLT